MKFLNDRIRLGFRNEKALVNDRLLFEKNFPIEVLKKTDERIDVMFQYDSNQTVFDEFITTLADYIINQYEKKILKHILLNNYGDLKPFQLQDIVSHLPELEQEKETCRAKRRSIVKNELYNYFAENNSASVEGLVTFRMKEYETLLNQAAEQLFDIYLTYKEYAEFIELLRYFVNVQSARPRLTHLIVHSRGMYTILNEEKEDITEECISDFARPEEISTDNFDDLLISILITLAPERIIVHNSDCIKNAELFDTINKVFGKVEYCTGCEMCAGKTVQCKL